MGIYKDTYFMATNLIDSYMNNYHNSQTGKQQTSLGVSQISYSNSQQTVNTIKCSDRVPSKDTVTIGNHKIKGIDTQNCRCDHYGCRHGHSSA